MITPRMITDSKDREDDFSMHSERGMRQRLSVDCGVLQTDELDALDQ